MISFRFHLVSLTAIFLALAIGIGIGATVVNQATVETIQSNLEEAKRRATATNTENDALREDVGEWQRFGDQGAAALVRGKLDVPVVVVGVQGIDRKPVDAFRQLLIASGARLQGTVWFTSKLRLSNPEDLERAQGILGSISTRPEVLRRAIAARLAEGWTPGGQPTVLPALRDAGFLDFEPPSGDPVDLTAFPPPGVLSVVVSGRRAEVANVDVAVPFVTALLGRAPNTVLAAEAGRDATADQPAERAVYLRPLLGDSNIANRLTTVDNLEDLRGRIAAVLALAALVEGKTGHYGVGTGAQRMMPEVAP
jgi:hypothetical protein